jgi:hypothetical protein
VRWGDLSQTFGVRRYLKAFKANTRFSRHARTRTMAGKLTHRETDSQWSPLLDLDLTLKTGLSAALRVDHGATHTEDLGSLVTDRSLTRVSLTAKRSLNITREVTVPLRKTKERITTKLDVSLTFKYDADRSVNRQIGSVAQVSADTRRLDFSLAGGYQFSRTVNGRAVIEFGENGNAKNRTQTTRYVGLNLSASFTF